MLNANLEQIDAAARRVEASTDDVAPDALRRLHAGDTAYGDRRVASAWTSFRDTWATGLDVLVGGAGSVGRRLAQTSAAYRAVDEQASDRLGGLQPW